MADRLAETFCHNSCTAETAAGGHDSHMLSACQDDLDSVASSLTWKDLEQASAMLNAVARACRQTFPSDSLGWEDAARLTVIADMIETAWVAAFEKANPDLVNDFNHKRENPLSTL